MLKNGIKMLKFGNYYVIVGVVKGKNELRESEKDITKREEEDFSPKVVGEHFMCRKLEELSSLKVKDLYERLDEEFVAPPINIHRILDKLGVEYDAMDFSLINDNINGVILPDQADLVMGAVAAHSESEFGKDSVEITVNIKDGYHRQRFTLAHELAHCMLHADSLRNGSLELRTSLTPDNPREEEANILAGEILIPENLLRIVYASLPIPLLGTLAKEFDVSENVMAARLQHLRMGYYTI